MTEDNSTELRIHTDSQERPFLSVVTPMFNEAEGIVEFLQELKVFLEDLGRTYEVLVVDDGSRDTSVERALSIHWRECRVLALSKNCGHQIALEAGMAASRGTWVLTMDSDGQHPPECIQYMISAALDEDADVVYMRQPDRTNDSWAKRSAATMYYRIIRTITKVPIADSQADFRLIHRPVVEAVLKVPGDKVLRLLLPAIGYRSVTLEYSARDRIAGKGRFGAGWQFKMALLSILGFTSAPLRLVALSGLVISAGAAFWLLYVLVTYMQTRTVTGWSSVMAAVLTIGGLTLLSVSVVGEYLARVYDLLKAHPKYSARFVDGSANSGKDGQ